MEISTRSLVLILLVFSPILILFNPSPARAQPSCNTPFLIDGGNFSSVATGSGALVDPYVIENCNIVTSASVAIHIRNTQSFFVIRNVVIRRTTFTGESEGIYFEGLNGVQNGLVENAQITNFVYGIRMSPGVNDMLTTSRIWNNTYGVEVAGTTDTISNNLIWNNTVGVHVDGTGHIVRDNHSYNNTRYAISVTNSARDLLTGNNASANGNRVEGTGFLIIAASNDIFANNTAVGNTWFGFKLWGEGPIAASTNNVISNNTVSGNGNLTGGGGIVLVNNCTNNLVIGNQVTNELNAIGLEGDDFHNNVTMNRVSNSTNGIYVVINSAHNLVYNNFLNCTVNAVDNGLLNAWNTTETIGKNILGGPYLGGNFYADYHGTDPDRDGIGDTPYATAGISTLDLLPLVRSQPAVVHDVAVLSVNGPASVPAGTRITIIVTTFNRGTVTESFNISLTYNQTVIAEQRLTNVPAWSTTMVTIPWDTTGLYTGAYILKANASIVPGELIISNNISPPFTVTLAATLPGAPFSFQLTVTGGKAVLTWGAPSNSGGSPIAKYKIFRSESASGPWVNIANTTDTSYMDNTVSLGQTYYYQVVTVNQAGLSSQPSTALNVRVPGRLSILPGGLRLWIAVAVAVVAVAGGVIALRSRRKSPPGSRA